MVAVRREETGPPAASCRSRSYPGPNGVKRNARHFLCRRGLLFFRCLLGPDEGLRQTVGDKSMDYIIAGIACVCLFVYLTYALLRAERF
jgi:K+-transporting ATPase KdpF subunit